LTNKKQDLGSLRSNSWLNINICTSKIEYIAIGGFINMQSLNQF